MKYLITLLITVLSLNAFSQGIPQLPYNPDENGDGLIGVPDLQALLAQYGLEFNSAVLSEDAQSAIVYMGEMAHPVCSQACDNLPGFWHMATMADLGLVWGEVIMPDHNTWHKSGKNDNDCRYINPSGAVYSTIYTGTPYRCYCAAHELPKVEYKRISGYNEEYVTSLASEGWKLLDGATGGNNGIYGVMWRWAE